MASPCALLFHHADYAGHFVWTPESRYTRLDTYCIQIPVDVPVDKRFPWFFKGLSLSATNDLLRVITAHASNPYRGNMSSLEIKTETVPYDDMPFETATGESLNVVYSIASPNARIRTGVIGPHEVELYEKDSPMFGPVYVYACNRSECEVDGELNTVHTMCAIRSSPSDILAALSALNFGA